MGTNFQVANTGNTRIGTGAFDASAALTVNSTTQGALLPRMTSSERDAISSPADGLIVYNTTDKELNVYDSGALMWTSVGAAPTFPLLAPDGTSGVPSYSFFSDGTIGMYRTGSGYLGLSEMVHIDSTLHVYDGLGNNPGIHFQGAAFNSGLYASGDTMRIHFNGGIYANFSAGSSYIYRLAGRDTLSAGINGEAGNLDVFPATSARGRLRFTSADNTTDTTTTVHKAAQSGARTYTITDSGASASFVMTEGAQTLNGAKTFTSKATLSNGVQGELDFLGVNNGIFTGIPTRLGIRCGGTTMAQLDATFFQLIGECQLILSKDTDQIYFDNPGGGSSDVLINVNSVASQRTYSIVDTGTVSANFIMSEGTKTINGDTGIGGAPITNGLLTISSTTKAFVPPRMTSTERDAITSPAAGMMVYNTTSSLMSFYDGATWQNISAGSVSYPLLAPNSLASAPNYSFSSDTNTGIYWNGPDAMSVSAGGIRRFTVSDTNSFIETIFGVTSGSAGAPALYFGSESDTGLFLVGADNLGFSTGGVQRANLTNTAFNVTASVLPTATNTYDSGSTTNKWANVWGTTIHSGDIELENQWRITEGEKIGHPEEGVMFVSPTGKKYKISMTEVE